MFRRRAFGILCVIAIISKCGAAAPANDDICSKPKCLEIAKRLKRQMGSSDPCDDFHNYVCGNWSGSKELQSSELKTKAVADLERLLERARAPATTSPSATDKLILAYKSCVSSGRLKKALKAGIHGILSLYQMGEWPILKQQISGKQKETVQKILTRTGPRPVFRYYVSDENDSSATIVMTAPDDFYVSDIDYSDYGNLYDERSDAGTENATYDFHEEQARSEAAYKTFIVKSIDLLRNKSVRQKQAAEVADGIIAFEKTLSKFAASKEKETLRMTLEQFSDRIGNKFPMTKILRTDFHGLDVKITRNTIVFVKDLDYYKNAVEFMKKPSNLAALKNYIMWTKVRSMAEAVGTLLHDIYLEYKRNTSILGLEDEYEIKNTKLACVNQLLETHIMRSAAASYYIKAKFDKDSKEGVLKMMEFLKSAFKYIIVHNGWMSPHTKTQALRRVSKMKTVIGYPDWMLNDTTVNSLYQFVPRNGKNESFVKHYYWLRENDHKQQLLKLNNKYFAKEYEDVPLSSHAYYNEPKETLVYPAAALVTHYRTPPIPRSINFGTIGTTLSMLFTNVIDRFDYGYQHGKRVVLDFWSNDTKKNFCSLSSCLNNTEECNDTEGVQSSNHQHLRDYFGVRTSFLALRRSKSNYTGPYLLPGKKFNKEQKIFFTAFGTLYCPYSVNEKFVQERADDQDDSFRETLNQVVYGYKQFNATFECDGKEEAEKCDLMPTDKTRPDSQAC